MPFFSFIHMLFEYHFFQLFLIQTGKQVPNHKPSKRKNIDDKIIFIFTFKIYKTNITEKYPQNR